MPLNNSSDRNSLTPKAFVDSNREFDYLSAKEYEFPKNSVEQTLIVSDRFLYRLDYVSFLVYGTVNLWWFIALRNNIINQMTDMRLGQTLFIPPISDYYDFWHQAVSVSDDDETVFDKKKIV